LKDEKMSKFNNKSGMTIIELGVAMLTAAIMIYAGSQLFNQLSKEQRAAEERTIVQTLATVGNRQIWQDTRTAGHSMNVLSLTDDNGRNFYDLNPELACGGMPDDCMRTFTITTTNNQSFIMLTEWNSKRRHAVTFDPSRAYNTVASNLPWDVNPPLTFNNTRLGETLFNEGVCATTVGSTKCGPSSALPPTSKYVLMKSGGESPRLNAAGLPVPGSIKRASSVLGSTNALTSASGSSQFLTFAWLNRAHPEDPAQGVIANFDHFFLTIPPLGGRAGLVQAFEVKAIRYCLKKPDAGPDKDFFSLYREECTTNSGCSLTAACNSSASGWSKGTDLAFRVKEIVFKRPNINLPVIYFEIETLKSL
jgi:hypothetical protein